MTIVPITSHIHFDDVQRNWQMKVSREEKDPGGTKIWVPLQLEGATLTDILTQLLLYWALAPAGMGDGIKTEGTIGDLGDLADWMAVADVMQQIAPLPLGAPEGFVGADPELEVFDGGIDDWGVTAP